MKVTISSSNIKVPAEMYRIDSTLVGVEFNGIFFDESTGIVVDDLNNNTLNGTVIKVFGNRAVIRIHNFESALMWDMIYRK